MTYQTTTKQQRIKPFRVICWRRKQAENAQGLAPIMFEIKFNGQTKTVHSGIYCKADELSTKEFAVLGNNPATQLLQSMKSDFEKSFSKVSLSGEIIDLGRISDMVMKQGGYVDKTPLFREVLEQLVTRYREQTGKITTKGTLKAIITAQYRLHDYLRDSGKWNIRLAEIKPVFVSDVITYMQSKKGYSKNYANKVIRVAMQVLNHAEDAEWIPRNPLRNVRLKHERVNIVYLDEKEIEQLKTYHLHNDTFDLVRDGFLFQVYTGLAYTDMTNALIENLTTIDDMPCLRVKREKTNTPCLIPLLPPALALIEKYKDWPFCKHYGRLIPTITNQKMNNYLKEIAGICGISKHLTTHVGRKSAATFLVNNGVSPVVIQSILGHSSFTTTANHYAVTMEQTIVREMNDLAKRKFPTMKT
ncbi:site-specific integrase [Spirosoma sp. KCTC 42546]|uniref:site-specific integrase n=1 Tax=Spirosoma sp. KCTC 42546 TaxID=2520506 RepID=UPI0011572217|nr:site-specific integrase [Spirosoma sp. KCTC 42546]QDK77764.1 site-specific integrase [Spirosoma sp. KCTC 42546]